MRSDQRNIIITDISLLIRFPTDFINCIKQLLYVCESCYRGESSFVKPELESAAQTSCGRPFWPSMPRPRTTSSGWPARSPMASFRAAAPARTRPGAAQRLCALSLRISRCAQTLGLRSSADCCVGLAHVCLRWIPMQTVDSATLLALMQQNCSEIRKALFVEGTL